MTLAASDSVLVDYRLEGAMEEQPGFLAVYEASRASNGERVAVTAFPVPGERRIRKAFRRAARERAAAAHPGLVPAREVLESDGQLYLVTEARPGSTLTARLAQSPLEPHTAVHALEHVAAALDEVDWVADALLSSTRILLDDSQDGRGVLLDSPKAVSLREIGWPWVHPHPHYAPPEISRGDHLGGRTLVYSLGCILFECVCGSRPFEGDWLDLMEAHWAGSIPLASERRPDLGTALDGVLLRAMAKDPADRFGAARDLMEAAGAALTRARETRDGVSGSIVPAITPAPAVTAKLRPAAVPEGHPEPKTTATSDERAEPREAGSETEDVTPGRPPMERAAAAARDAQEKAERAARAEAERVARQEEAERVAREEAERSGEPASIAKLRNRARHERIGPTTDSSPREGPLHPPRVVVLACAVIAGCALVISGYLTGKGQAPSAEPARSVTSGPVSLDLPVDWQQRPARGMLPGVPLRDAVAGRRSGSADAGIVAGSTQRTREDFLPSHLTTRHDHAAEPVRLGSYDAYRHREVRAGNSRDRLTIYSIPTPGGAVVVACQAVPAIARGFMPACERVASTVDLHGASALSLNAIATERRRLATILSKLRRRRSAGRRRLAAAGRPGRQAREARSLQLAYAEARRAISRLDAAAQPRRWQSRAVTEMSRIEGAYGQLANAAARRSRPRYDGARRSVKRSEAVLARLIDGVAASRHARGQGRRPPRALRP